jgi:hypothetical protein
MRLQSIVILSLMSVQLASTAHAATKLHVISFGKWTTVKWLTGPADSQPIDLKIRPLFIDGRVKEFALGIPHDITDRLFVVRRAFRLNDALPDEANSSSHWRWERGGWLLVDRISGHISQISLLEFDPHSSAASWYRDYVSYCGVSDDGKKLFAMVVQLGRRKPILKKALGEVSGDGMPDSECPVPAWQRQPTRVTFAAKQKTDEKFTYAVKGHAVDLLNENSEDDAEEGTK